MGTWPDTDDEKRQKMFRLAMALKDEIGLTDEERHELALMIPGVQDGSWKNLDTREMHILLNYLEGFQHILYLLAQRLGQDNE